MFNAATRQRLVMRFRTPVRRQVLRAIAEDVMPATRYKSVPGFINAMLDENVIRKHILEGQNGKKLSLYSSQSLAAFSPYEIAHSIFPDGYFCHLTAIYHHGLTDQIPSAVYMCHETIQAKKGKSSAILSESAVRSAFIKPPRHTNYVIKLPGHDLVVLDRARGSDCGAVKVVKGNRPCPAGSRVAGLERALIDAVVAPHYNGGVTSLPAYFRRAQKKLKVDKVLRIYRKLRFVYPYAQALGFFLEHAGMRAQADRVRKVYPPRHRFYVDHSARESWVYNERWMICYPGGLVDEN